MKYYAVKNGLTPGIYTDWDTCRAQVDGFSGAQYKSFKTIEEARIYLGLPAGQERDITKKIEAPCPAAGEAIAYVDGSYSEKAQKFSYGIVLFVNLPGISAKMIKDNSADPGKNTNSNIREIHMSKAFTTPELLEMRNVAGEIMGAAEAMKSASEMGCTEITIYHDYEGIAKWCTGEWQTKKVWTNKYKSFYNDIRQKIHVNFIKVKAHQAKMTDVNAYYNNIADELAKQAIAD